MISISWTTFKKLVISCRLPGYQYWLCLSSFNSLASRRLLFLPATLAEKSFTVSWFIHYLGGILAQSKHCCRNLKLAAGALCPAPTLQKNSWSHSQKCKKKNVYWGFNSCSRDPLCPIKGVCRNQTTSAPSGELIQSDTPVSSKLQKMRALNGRSLLPVSLFTSHNCCYSCLILIKWLLKPWNNLHGINFSLHFCKIARFKSLHLEDRLNRKVPEHAWLRRLWRGKVKHYASRLWRIPVTESFGLALSVANLGEKLDYQMAIVATKS